MAKRNNHLQKILENAAYELVMMETLDVDEEERIFNELEENACIFAGLRFSFRGNVPKSFKWYDEILPDMDDMRFRMLLRCSRQQFNVILALIENNPVFHGTNSHKQFTVQFQLALVLYRLGSNGDGATLTKIATLFGIGDGGTIDKITVRVFDSILTLEKDFLYWPSEREREELVIDSFEELPHCIGYTDGTIIPLKERPVMDHTSYYSKDQVYAIKLQSVCDFRLLMRQATIGYPGCVHDARIYNNCRLATEPKKFFSGEQYLVNDSAYKLTTTVVTPFRKNSTELTAQRRSAFNKYLSTYRVRIEHLFGILKEKFSSLKLLSVKISDAKSHKFACTWVRVCCLLYNILLPHFDQEDLEPKNWIQSQEDDEYEGDENQDEAAKSKRIALVQLIEAK